MMLRRNLGIAFSGTAALLLSVSAWSYRRTNEIVERGERTEGTVLRHEEWSKGGSRTMYYPVVAFTTRAGEAIEREARNGSHPPAHDVGDIVALYYDPRDPEGFVLDGFYALWGLSLTFGAAGLGAALTGGLLLRAARRR